MASSLIIEEEVDVPSLLESPNKALFPVLGHLMGWAQVCARLPCPLILLMICARWWTAAVHTGLIKRGLLCEANQGFATKHPRGRRTTESPGRAVEP